jgi:hypothetical protein
MTDMNDVPASRRLAIFLIALIGTFVLTRFSLVLRPNADFNVAGYNVHHLFTGFLIACACAIPLALVPTRRRVTELLVFGLGVGLSLGLDEVVYLIVTDGTNASYLTRPSWIGGIVFVALAASYAVGITTFKGRSKDGSTQRTQRN